MRFRGFSLMHSLLESHQEDLKIVRLVRLYFRQSLVLTAFDEPNPHPADPQPPQELALNK